MARLDPEEGFEVLKDRVKETVKGLFPIIGKKHTLEVDTVDINDSLSIDDIRSQKKAKDAGRTWAVPVEATVKLRDSATNKIIDTQKIKLLDLPKVTRRFSHIVNGQEYQIDNQWRLKPGVYSMIKDDGALKSQFNLSKGRGFHVKFDPKDKRFLMEYGTSNIPLAPLMQELGVSPEKMKKDWGDQISASNVENREQALLKFYKASTGQKTSDTDLARQHLWDTFQNTEMGKGEVNKITLGKNYQRVNGDSLLDASKKLLSISQGTATPDPRDSLMFKDLHSVEDFTAERIQKGAYDINRRVRNTIDRRTKVKDIVGSDIFNRPVQRMFTHNSLANVPEQTNPLEMVSGATKTTITGEGGIKGEHGISDEAKLIDPSHLGYLDPIHTPEGKSTGVSLRLPIGVHKVGHEVRVKMFDPNTGKNRNVGPGAAMNATIVLPDQVSWENGKPKFHGKTVKMSGPGNEIVEGDPKKADLIMRDPSQMFSIASNLIPFMAADHPNRSTMAGRHMEQSIPLAQREAPLVQAKFGKRTFDDVLGGFAAIKAPSGISDGTVVDSIKDDAIILKGTDGKKREVQIYNHFPLNADKAFIHSTPSVKVGDTVKKGQILADSNFTKGGTMALGTNMRVGYMSYKGYNFEDGVVISETAAKKMASEHLHRKAMQRDKNFIFDKNKFRAYTPDAMNTEQSDKLDDEGVIKPGTVVMPGDTVVAALRERFEHERVEDSQLAKIHKSAVKPYRDASLKWEKDMPGIVQEVVKKGKNLSVNIKTLEPMEIGDKLAGRHGNKGIVTKIIRDDEMPHTKDGVPLEVLLNPTGVPGRTNLGQVLETAAGKIALKTGQPYVVKNFQPGADLHKQVSDDLKAHGISDKEEIFDPANGRKMGDVLVGPQHMIKLKHQVDTKLRARAGGPGYAYDRNLIPKGGGAHGAQALGTLGLYSMLAHGAKANLREMQTLKSDAEQGDQFWTALQAGEMLPAPRTTFAYKKFNSYLNALGVNVKKEGNNLQLVPFTDKQISDMSNGEIKDPGKWVRSKDLKPEKGGLFDPETTGGMNGTKWGHYKLPEALPNPLFEGAVQSLTGLSGKQYSDIIAGRKAIDTKTGQVTDDIENNLVGGKAFGSLLGKINVSDALKVAQTELNNPNLKGNRLDRAHKKVKYLSALKNADLDPKSAYMMQNVPILPPSMRPLSVLPNGSLNEDDVNGLYKNIALSASKFKEMSPLIPDDDESKVEIREEVYDGLRALTGLGGHSKQTRRGILDTIGGKRIEQGTGKKIGSPKEGYFQDKLVQRKQDLSMRSTIIPEPAMGLDEVGLPRSAATELYKPFIIGELRRLTGMSPLQARKAVKEGGELVNRALERVIETRPVLLKRDPALHKFSIQAFKPRIVQGKAVQIHPLVTSGYNADFDGDAMSAFVPASQEAVDEAKKMMPSHNLFSPSTGELMYTPTLETRLGLYGVTKEGNKTAKKFGTIGDVESSHRKGDIKFTDQITVGGLAGTTGRFMVAGALPSSMRKSFLQSKTPLDGKGQAELLTAVARDHKNDYGEVVNKLKDLGNQWSTDTAFSIGLDDVKPERALRDSILAKADKEVAKLSGKDRDAKAIDIYAKATQDMHGRIDRMSENNSNLLIMHRSGIKPTMDSLRQIKMSPMLIANAKGEVIPTPVRKSFSEGLDISDYWTSMSGARKGIIQKVQSVEKPGFLSKQVMNSTMNNIILDDDCGTDKGISLATSEKDILDRYLAASVKSGKKTFGAGTLITPDIRNSLRNNKIGKVVVRSPLRCNHGPGLCKKCFGLDESGESPELGTNIGVQAGQAIGERSVQLAMKAFHTGGTAATKNVLTDEFQRVQDMLLFPKNLPGSATLSNVSGRVEKMDKDPAGGHNVFIGGQRHYVPQNRGVPIFGNKEIKVGMNVRKGDPISRGPVNPHDMLPLTGVEPVQNYLANELHGIYGRQGIRRRNSEVVVKALTNLTRVEDPGDSGDYIRGDFAPQTHVANLNRGLKSGQRPIVHQPVLKGVNVLPHEMQEDWLARLNHDRLGQTVIEAAQQGWISKIHGPHPIPAVVYGAEFGKGKPGEY